VGTPRILVSIASYRDPLLGWTIRDAYENATNKDHLFFAVVEQAFESEALDYRSLPFSKQIRYIRVNPEQSRGCCWARSVAQTLWGNEDYYFQIDSHIGFDPGWDTLMHAAMQHLREHHDRPLITNMPYALEAKDDDIVNNPVRKIRDDKEFQELTRICRPVQKETTFKDNYFIGVQCDYVPKKNFVPGYLVAAGCLFTLGKWVEEVPYDPYLFFEGEEQSIALRSWTHGYSIFHISPLMFYHYYISAYKQRFWSDDVEKQSPWQALNERSFNRLQKIVTGDDMGIYGLGTRRSLHDYIRFTGIDYLNKKVEPKAMDKSVFSGDYRLSPRTY
jgi:hypothetical protein